MDQVLDLIELLLLILPSERLLLSQLCCLKDLVNEAPVALAALVFGIVRHSLADLDVPGLQVSATEGAVLGLLNHGRKTQSRFNVLLVESLQVLLADNLRLRHACLPECLLGPSHCYTLQSCL